MKQNGQQCGRGFMPGNTHCATHRPRSHNPREFKPCELCGQMTRRTSVKGGEYLCARQSCGLYEYQAERRRCKKAAATERAREAEDEANQDICAAVMDDYVADLIDSFDASTVRPVPPPPPPAAWKALSSDAQSELVLWIRQAIEADRRDAQAAPAHAAAAISSH
jgi:hypothetical protein